MKWQIQPEFLSSLYLIPNSSPFPLLRGWPGVDSGGGVGVRVHSSLYQENPGSTSCGCCAGARVSYFIFKRRGHIPFIQAFEPIYFNTPHVRGGSRTCTREGGGGGETISSMLCDYNCVCVIQHLLLVRLLCVNFLH